MQLECRTCLFGKFAGRAEVPWRGRDAAWNRVLAPSRCICCDYAVCPYIVFRIQGFRRRRRV